LILVRSGERADWQSADARPEKSFTRSATDHTRLVNDMRLRICVAIVIPASLNGQTPVADHHQHLFSPAAAALVTGDTNAPGIDARRLVAREHVTPASHNAR
jgi:hypothetical protein